MTSGRTEVVCVVIFGGDESFIEIAYDINFVSLTQTVFTSHAFVHCCCLTDIDYCSTTECLNGGTCIPLLGGSKCNCTYGYSGPQCNKGIHVFIPSHFAYFLFAEFVWLPFVKISLQFKEVTLLIESVYKICVLKKVKAFITYVDTWYYYEIKSEIQCENDKFSRKEHFCVTSGINSALIKTMQKTRYWDTN